MLEILFPSLKEGKNCKIFLALRLPPDPAIVFGANQTFSPSPCFTEIFLNMQHFPNSMYIFITSGIGPDILSEVFENYIHCSFGQAGFCLIFIWSKNKAFRSGALLQEIHYLLSWRNFLNNKNTFKKMQVSTK